MTTHAKPRNHTLLNTRFRLIFGIIVILLAGIGCQSGGTKPAKTPTEKKQTVVPRPTEAQQLDKTQPPAATSIPTETSAAPYSPTDTPQPPATKTPPPAPSATSAPAASTDTPLPVSPTMPLPPDAMSVSLANAEAIDFLTSLTDSDFGKISQVVWSPDGKRLAVIGQTGIAMLNADTLATLWKKDYISDDPQMVFSQDGRLLVIADGLGYVSFYEAESGQFLQEAELGISGPIAVSPDGRLLAYPLSWGVQLLDWENNQKVMFLESAEDAAEVNTLDFSADGKKLIAGSWDQSVQVWRVEDGKRTRTFEGAFPDGGPSYCRSGDGVRGNTLVLICSMPADDYQTTIFDIWLWDVNNDQNQNVVQFVDKTEQGYYGFTASPNRQKLGLFVSAQEGLELWNVAGGFALDRKLPTTRRNGIAFNPVDGGNTLVTWDAVGLEVWDVNAKTILRERSELIGVVNVVAFSPAAEGRLLAAGNSRGQVALWDVRSGKELRILEAGGDVTSLAFSRDGSRLAADGDQAVLIWDMGGENHTGESDQPLATFPYEKPVNAVALNSDGSILAVGGQMNAVELWDVKSQNKLRVFDIDGVVHRLTFSPDGNTLAVGVSGESGCNLQLWDISTGDEGPGFAVEGEYFTSLAFSADGFAVLLTTDARLQVWDIEEGKRQRSYYLTEDQSQYYASAFSPDQCVVGLGYNEHFQLYDLTTDTFFLSFHGDVYRIYSVAFSPDGRLVASGGYDGAVRLWGVKGALEEIGDPAALGMCSRIGPPPTPTPTPIPTPTLSPTPTPVVTATFTPTPPPFTRTLYLTDPHMQGDDVLLLQQRLLELGYTEVGTPDGDFGKKTDTAVRHFQELNGLEADGVVGPKTWERLFSSEAVGP